MFYSISLNKKIDAQYLIKSIDALITKYSKENSGLDDCLLIFTIKKITKQSTSKIENFSSETQKINYNEEETKC